MYNSGGQRIELGQTQSQMPVSWESRSSAKSRSKQLRSLRRQREEDHSADVNDLSQGSIDHEIPLGHNAPLALKNLAV